MRESSKLPAVNTRSGLSLVASFFYGKSISQFNLEFSSWGEVFAHTNMLFNNVGRVGIDHSFLVLFLVGMRLLHEGFTSFLLKFNSGVKTKFVEFDVVNNRKLASINDSE